MTEAEMELTVKPTGWSDREALLTAAGKVAQRLGLAQYLQGITLVADDLSADDRPWIKFPSGHQAVIYCHPDHFRNVPSSGFGVLPATLPWELKAAKPAVVSDYSPAIAARFLYHHFLLMHDLVSGLLGPKDIPSALLEGFQEAWAVTVDGRLKRRRLPGWSSAERRRRFFRVFSAGGMLLPRHWRIFHEIWDMESPDQTTIRNLTAQLPSLVRQGR